MQTRIVFSAFLAILVFFSLISIGLSQGLDQVPPFVQGEVAVYAQPDQLRGFAIAKFLPNAGISVVKTDSGREWGLLQRFRQRGFKAGLNLKAHASSTPNDPYFSYQWHFKNVQAESAWGWGVQIGAGVTVAVLDTGLAEGGEDGIPCVSTEAYDVVNGDFDPADGDGHGTHVSGTVAQRTNNSIGVAGLAYGACVLPVKVLDDTGSGSFADIAEGVFYAVNNGAHVINMSLGTNARFGITHDPIMDPALDYAYEKGVTVVCASGNDGSKKNVSYPAIYPTTIAVGATDYSNQVTRYSNKGKGLDLVAPGGDLSKDLNSDGYGDGVLQETLVNGAWGYYFFDGTSMASPHVAALAALLIAEAVAITPDEVYTVLTSTTLDLEDPGYDKSSGYGLVQAYSALNYVPDGCTDADGDGWCQESGDCNDGNASVNPSEEEICGDEIDNNCDGQTDETCGGTCTDKDVDGWCVEDGDCDDNDRTVYPGHPDKGGRWGTDGKDNDCNSVIDG
jgi:serine protease